MAENTLVVFTSDNGGERFSDNWPLVGGKMDLLEGGIRVPYIARWPARVPPGMTTARLAITMDWVATFLNAAGVSPHPDYPLDGIDLLGDEKPRSLYWRMKFREQKALFCGDTLFAGGCGRLFEGTAARQAAKDAIAARNPQRRLIDASEVAEAVLFLCGEQARGINGEALVIDGGELRR